MAVFVVVLYTREITPSPPVGRLLHVISTLQIGSFKNTDNGEWYETNIERCYTISGK